jgi:hypothetical protein
MMDENWIPKISDWGMSHRNGGGTKGYYPPEYFIKNQI